MVTELVNLILELNSVFDLETVFLRKRRDVVIIRSHTIKGKASRLGWFCWLVEGERESSWWVWPYLLGGWCLLQSYPPSQLTGPPILLLLLILLLHLLLLLLWVVLLPQANLPHKTSFSYSSTTPFFPAPSPPHPSPSSLSPAPSSNPPTVQWTKNGRQWCGSRVDPLEAVTWPEVRVREWGVVMRV